MLGLRASLSLKTPHPSEAPLSTQNEHAKGCRWWFRASACRVEFGVFRSSGRMTADDRHRSTTFAKAIKNRVNPYGSLLAIRSAGSSVQNLVGRRQATQRMYLSPVILGYCFLSISHQVKGFGHWQRDTLLGKLHCCFDRNGGREPVNLG